MAIWRVFPGLNALEQSTHNYSSCAFCIQQLTPTFTRSQVFLKLVSMLFWYDAIEVYAACSRRWSLPENPLLLLVNSPIRRICRQRMTPLRLIPSVVQKLNNGLHKVLFIYYYILIKYETSNAYQLVELYLNLNIIRLDTG